MRISGHTWTRTIKTQDIWQLAQYLTYVYSVKNVSCVTPNQAMWPSTTNVSHDKLVVAVLL